MAVKHYHQAGFGRRIAARVLTVDKQRRRIEVAIRDGGAIYIPIFSVPSIFRWPKTGEIWYIRRSDGQWRFDEPVDLAIQERTGDDDATTTTALEDIEEGSRRVSGPTTFDDPIEITTSPDPDAPADGRYRMYVTKSGKLSVMGANGTRYTIPLHPTVIAPAPTATASMPTPSAP